MYNGKNISLGSILWKIMKHPLATELSYEDAAEFALEYIKLVGAPVVFENIISQPIKIVDYKCLIPNNLLNIKGVKYLEDCIDTEGERGVALTQSSNIYHNIPSIHPDFTYKSQSGVIITSQPKGYIMISYEAISVDDEGYPLIPDQEEFKLGLEYYILHRYIEPLWIIGKITDKSFNYIESKRHFYLASASNKLQLPGVDEMETIMNGLNRILHYNGGHSTFFKNYGNKENINKYN